MITLPNDKRILGLEDTVRQLVEDVSKHYEIDRTLANFGIKIVGVVPTKQDLPDPNTYPGQYGDAYAVGDTAQVEAGTASYDYYIFTRPTNVNSENSWLDVGELAIRGPQGPVGVGEKGEPGESSTWYYGTTYPQYEARYRMGDMYLRTGLKGEENGNVYWYNGISWDPAGNILGPRGEQGIQGPKGEKGDTVVGPQGEPGPAGRAINIRGALGSISQFPTASATYANQGYLVTSTTVAGTYNLWVCIASAGGSYQWIDAGPYTGGTVITDASGNAMDTVAYKNINNPIFYEHQLNISFYYYGSDHFWYTYDKVSTNAVTLNFNVAENPTIGAVSPLVSQGNSWQFVSGVYDHDGSYQDPIIAIKRNSDTEIVVKTLTGDGSGEHQEVDLVIPLSDITDVVTKDFKNQINYNT